MMDQHILQAFLSSGIAAIITTFGIYTVRYFKTWGKEKVTYFSCFAAGILISASFLHLIPKALSMNRNAPIFLLSGYLFLHLVNKFIDHYVCDQTMNKNFNLGLIPLFGIGFHSFIDGLFYLITFTVATFTGILASVGLILHEFPEGIVVYLLLLKSGFKEKTSFGLAFLAAALTTPLGTFFAVPLLQHIHHTTLGNLLAASAGALIYVGATHLLPYAEQSPKKHSLLAFLFGIGITLLMIYLKLS